MVMIEKGILLNKDKEKIAYYHFKNNHDKVIIISHGFYNSKDATLLQDLAASLKDEYDVLMFDFRGHGESSGLFFWISKEDKDLEAILDYLEGGYKKIGIVAFSLGGAISINTLSENHKVDSLVCVATPSEFIKVDFNFWALSWRRDILYTLITKEGRKGKGVRPGPFWLKKKKPIESVETMSTPVLYIHGSRDWVIRPWHSEALFGKTRSKKKLVVIKNGPHAEYLMLDYREVFLKEVKDWLKETLNKEEE